jgi:hypothetical protein
MHKRSWCGYSFGLLTALTLSLGEVEQVSSAEPAQPGQGQRAKEFIAAFNKGDARAVASFWTPEGDYVDQVGRTYNPHGFDRCRPTGQ